VSAAGATPPLGSSVPHGTSSTPSRQSRELPELNDSPDPEDPNAGVRNAAKEKDFVSSTITATTTISTTPAATKPPAPTISIIDGSLRRNFSWTFVGNIFYSACQAGILMLLAKIGNPEMVGKYGLAMAIATPVLALSSLQLRAVLTTDVKEKIPFGEYLGFRLLTTLLSLVVISGIALTSRRESMFIVIVMGISQGIEMVSDLYYGRMQFQDNMDRIAKSMILRGVLGLAALAAGVYFTHQLIWGVIGLTIARAATLLFYDINKRTQLLPREMLDRAEIETVLSAGSGVLRPRWSFAAQSELMRTSITLGVIAMLVSLLPNIPRYFLVGTMGERALGIFTATAFLVSTGNLIMTAMGQAAFVRLAKLYGARDVPGFNRLLVRLLGVALLLGIGGVGVALVAGKLLLTLIYRPEYAEHTDLLVAMMCAGALTYVASVLASAVTSARSFKPQIPVLASAASAGAISSYFLIHAYGLLGAGLAVVATSAVLCTGHGILLLRVRKSMAAQAAVPAVNAA
jgi:O-antigen/teichoic acid export membrane protein